MHTDDSRRQMQTTKSDSACKDPDISCTGLPRHHKQEEHDATSFQWPFDDDDSIDDQLERLRERLLRTQSTRSSGSSKSPRVLLLYNDERVRDQFCANAQRLLDAVLEDPHASSTSSLIAHKALRYRKITINNRLQEVDPRDPAFDISAFFGVEWRRKDIKVDSE
ncbi:hypothetical protein PF010_g27861 [Phytophthora fragariae]|uniref:Uncharacterized protein n=1 Tax=Phytophthora fragariae TaxID=53985 RepID=A0A6G0JTK6_9STRA|nr:hypothetical protein PF010_g27861 [Phytophthora fragariae]